MIWLRKLIQWFFGKSKPEKLVYEDLIKKWEGLRLNAYQDSVGVWTIGWGHTSTAKPGMSITKEEAQELFRKDVAWAEAAVKKHVKVDLKQNEFDALVSFVFNVGEKNFADSTLLKLLNEARYKAAAYELNRWVYAGGKKLKGLERRRTSEREYFLYGKEGKTNV